MRYEMNMIHIPKVLLCLMLVFSGFIGLTACSDMSSYWNDDASIKTAQDCQQASVLVTNLTQKPEVRSYQLSDGRDCTGVVNNE